MMNKTKISISIISLGRESIYKTLEGIFSQAIYQEFEINIILQGKLDEQRIKLLNSNNIIINIYNYELGKGFGYYRNQAITKATGDILVWIDDDEYPKNNQWLNNIVSKILSDDFQVITAGTEIELGRGYITDSISYLGYPGGGAVGFKKMWTVNKNNVTTHLCSGNFAFHKSVLTTIKGFNNSLKSGAEDVEFATMLVENGIKIFYQENATIYHIHRSGIINFSKWHLIRGKSIFEFKKLGLIGGNHINDKMKSVKHILFDRFFSKYVFGIWFMFFLQNLFNLIGFFYAKIKFKNKN